MEQSLPHKIALALLVTGCTPPAIAPTERPAATYRLVQQDGLWFFETPRAARFELLYRGSARHTIGDAVDAELRVPNAHPEERHAFRVYPTRPGVRVLGEVRVETVGSRPTRIRFTTDTPGLGGIWVEEVQVTCTEAIR